MPPKAKPRACSRCGNQRPIYDHSAHHCEYCFQLLTNRDQNRLEELEAEIKRLQQENFDKSAQIIKLVDERIAQRAENATLKRKFDHLTKCAAEHCDRWSRAEGRERRAIQALEEIDQYYDWIMDSAWAGTKERAIARGIRQALAALDAGATNETEQTPC